MSDLVENPEDRFSRVTAQSLCLIYHYGIVGISKMLKFHQGKVALPDQSQMEADIHRKDIEMSQRYVKSPRHTIQVDYQFYMDELAELTGNKPEIGMYMYDTSW